MYNVASYNAQRCFNKVIYKYVYEFDMLTLIAMWFCPCIFLWRCKLFLKVNGVTIDHVKSDSFKINAVSLNIQSVQNFFFSSI